MKISRIDHINMSVNNLADSKAWYKNLFDFNEVESGVMDGVPWSILKSGDTMLCLYERPQLKHLDRFKMRGQGLHAISHFGLKIDNEEQWLKTLDENGVTLRDGDPQRSRHSKSWYLNDPTGYEIEVALWDDNQIQF